jgi:hypothetical protein
MVKVARERKLSSRERGRGKERERDRERDREREITTMKNRDGNNEKCVF